MELSLMMRQMRRILVELSLVMRRILVELSLMMRRILVELSLMMRRILVELSLMMRLSFNGERSLAMRLLVSMIAHPKVKHDSSNQCCGSGMSIPDPDFYPSRIRISDPQHWFKH
jgi:hypothetical protein